MPVVLVFVPDLGDVRSLLQAIADSAQSALGLDAADVVVTHVPVGPTALSDSPSATGCWPVVSFHGSRRGEAQEGATQDAAITAVGEWAASAGLTVLGVWTEWVG